MLKALTGELVNEVVQTCQQFHGGMGFIRETAIERLWRDARVLAIDLSLTSLAFALRQTRAKHRRLPLQIGV